MIQRITDLKRPPTIGEWFSVPTYPEAFIFPKWTRNSGLLTNKTRIYKMPVFLPAHEDGELLDFPIYHYHVDFRFMSTNMIIKVHSQIWPHTGKETRKDIKKTIQQLSDAFYLVRTNNKFDYGKIVWKDLMCRQEYFPPSKSIKKLEYIFREKKLKCGKCPHKQVDLSTIPSKDGVVTCPAHGLRWNLETRCLVKTH